MEIPKEAIEKAIEGGYLGGASFAKYRESSQRIIYEEEDYALPKLTKTIPEIALDPDFWSSLGKSLGWTVCDVQGCIQGKCDHGWMYYAKSFYDLILTGGDTKSFWQELLQ